MIKSVNYNGAALLLESAPEALPRDLYPLVYDLVEPGINQYVQAFAYDPEKDEDYLVLWEITSADFLKDFALKEDTCDWASPIVLRKLTVRRLIYDLMAEKNVIACSEYLQIVCKGLGISVADFIKLHDRIEEYLSHGYNYYSVPYPSELGY
ncbi:hypothetical protein [Paenibacillus larvae]|uniref:Uncharacterized protein n=1 Tax=Paenibacillus larvae subsp. larvae TaxID=147375 RepID=A0A6C0QZH5_9BACL|nr:hypothetical protein [Paenibacillus larvae]QHZ54000.1 hypothetical protein ERICV_05016 [Paenibacillus larvae subsp. larvae]QHZ54072.1 hypothetical protein ERICV_05088 [Paenibacillus larvae subsp. larvae]